MSESNEVAVPQEELLTDVVETKFRFKKDELGNQRQGFSLKFEVPSVQGIIEILKAGGKQLELLREAIESTIRGVIANEVGSNENFSQEVYDNARVKILDKEIHQFCWEAIANAPRAERKSIPKELWEAFCVDYMQVMCAVAGKTKDQVALATSVYVKKFSQVKTNKSILTKLQEQLGIYMENSVKAEEFQDILDVLNTKLDAYLKAEEPVILAENL